MNDRWLRYFFRIAKYVSLNSKDQSTKVGCVLVGPGREIRGTGYNGPPSGYPDDREEIHKRPEKYLYFVHAEQNVIAFAARNGISTEGCSVFVTMPPCADCAKLIIQAGIRDVYALASGDDAANSRWADHHRAARDMFSMCGVSLSIHKQEELDHGE